MHVSRLPLTLVPARAAMIRSHLNGSRPARVPDQDTPDARVQAFGDARVLRDRTLHGPRAFAAVHGGSTLPPDVKSCYLLPHSTTRQSLDLQACRTCLRLGS